MLGISGSKNAKYLCINKTLNIRNIPNIYHDCLTFSIFGSLKGRNKCLKPQYYSGKI